MRRATGSNPVSKIKAGISIHALLAESDTPAGKVRPWASHISIHALLAESDATKPSDYLDPSEFLSTLSLRRATKRAVRGTMRAIISIHALLAESDQRLPHLDIRAPNFYPRSPCGERLAQIRYLKLKLGFLSTLSLRRATHPRARCALGRPIFLSTLSLRRATPPSRPTTSTPPNFYPRSPCGERLSARCAAPCAR